MSTDRYIRLILTVIAIELLWLGVRDVATPLFAQQKSEPMAVVITGIRFGTQDFTTLPVAVVGSIKPNSIYLSRELPNVQPLSVQVSNPVQIETRQPLTVNVGNQPLTVETGAKPLMVDAGPAKPGAKPGA